MIFCSYMMSTSVFYSNFCSSMMRSFVNRNLIYILLSLSWIFSMFGMFNIFSMLSWLGIFYTFDRFAYILAYILMVLRWMMVLRYFMPLTSIDCISFLYFRLMRNNFWLLSLITSFTYHGFSIFYMLMM